MSRIMAVVILIAAFLWIGSGFLGEAEEVLPQQVANTEAPAAPFRVAVLGVAPEMHARTITLSGRTEADDRASAVARTAGIIDTLSVGRGSRVEAGEVVAILSDEARLAQVAQAEALVAQRQTDLDAQTRLIERGVVPANQKAELEANLRAAQAALAQAEAELERGEVKAPIAGIVSSVPVTAGRAVQAGAEIAEIVDLDPMLAVVEVAERQLGGIEEGSDARVRLVTGETVTGRVRFVSPTASDGTRTYRVDVEIANADGTISDGVTAEVDLDLAPRRAIKVPRSALTFDAEGSLIVRAVDEDGKVVSVPVAIVDDGGEEIWLSGPDTPLRVIVQGQDFVKEGEPVEAVPASA